MISVAATNSSDGQPSWTNYGAFVDVSAPGSSIPSTKNGGGYANYSGTSYATPVTAGVAALVMSADATLTPDEIEQVIEDSADDLGANGWDEHYGHGRVNAAAAVLAVVGGSPPGDSLPPTVSFLSPANGAVVSGTVSVDISASDNIGVSGVKLYANGSLVATDLNSPYQFGWDSSAFAQGASVTLAAKAWDAAGNEFSKSRSVTIADATPPVVSAPSDKVVEATGGLSGVSLGSATATDNVGGSLSAVPSTTGPFAVGVHTVVWTATDSAGNSASFCCSSSRAPGMDFSCKG